MGLLYIKVMREPLQFKKKTTREGNTEWNLFFKGVDQKNLFRTGISAAKNVGKNLYNK